MDSDEEKKINSFSRSTSNGTQDDGLESTILTGRKLVLVFAAFLAAFSLIALDQTILSTALPTIASHFQAVSDLSWIASAYFLPQAASILFFGRVLAVAPPKIVFLIVISIFLLGSLLCAVAPTVNFLIAGRAVAGLGAAGVWVSIMAIVARITTMQHRPLMMGVFGGLYALSSIVGPLIGGAFAEYVSWRWCFYINLPFGAVSLVLVTIILPNHPAIENNHSHIQRWLKLDWLGVLLSFGFVTTLLIALQWGGVQKPWSSATIIVLLVLFGFFLGAFFAWEHFQGVNAILPLKILFRRTIFGAFFQAFFVGLCFMVCSYYIPFYYQIKGHSATRSGIDILPLMVTGIITQTVAGAITTKTGYIWPFLFFGPLLAAIAFGLLYTVGINSSASSLIGYQILVGIGIGSCMQNSVVVAQAEFVDSPALVPLATSLVTFGQFIGSSVGLAVSGAILNSQLKSQLLRLAPNLPEAVMQSILHSVQAIFTLSPANKTLAVLAYMKAVEAVFLMGVPAAGLASLGALMITRRKIQTGPAVVAA